jgi:lipoprotein NlpI
MTATRTLTLIATLALPMAVGNAWADAAADANAGVRAAQAGRYDDAIQLFTSAINSDELNLTSKAQAFAYRGIARAATGDYQGAKLDLNFSVALDSGYKGDALAFRGYMKLVTGDPKSGAEDLASGAEYHVWSYSALWLYLARLRGGVPDTGPYSLKDNAIMLDATKAPDGSPGLSRWPGPVVKVMLGQATREEAAAAAKEGDPQRLAERVCDVDFYFGEVDLAHNETASAKAHFQNAAEKCPFASFERMGATAELARLK